MSSSPQAGATPQSERPQYHHYIPRFILRGFVDVIQPPSSPSGGFSKQQRKKYQRRNEQLNLISLHDGGLVQRPVARQYGLTDMYREYGAAREHGLEEKLARLEQKVGEIYAKARTAFDVPGSTLTLSRTEKNDLRKFLFLMKYRGDHMYSRFQCDKIEDYCADDKEKMRSYMDTKGFTTPRDVWLANLRAFLDVELDHQGKWARTIQQQAYRDDALLFVLHVGQSFMAFCKPATPDDEFLLTENVYCVHEGPSTQLVEVSTGERIRGSWTEWHNFAPVSASLLIVLRSNYLPGGVREADTELVESVYRALLQQHPDPAAATSMLQDLPVEKCSNSYSVVQTGQVVINEGVVGHSQDDRFVFRCFELGSKHVNIINGLALEHGAETASIVYKTSSAAAKALQVYLEDSTPGLKIVERPDSPMLEYLMTLDKVLRGLGKTAKVAFKPTILAPPKRCAWEKDYAEHTARAVGLSVAVEIYDKYPRLMKHYSVLAGDTYQSFGHMKYMHDVEQACKLLYILIKTDVITSPTNAKDPRKLAFRQHRQDCFLNQPASQIWLYVKFLRNLDNDLANRVKPFACDGPEDLIVRGSTRSRAITSADIFSAAGTAVR
ncbi:hypothetical protein LTR17_018160 [Elasticomyces elasticus]|nr:hypothetical protein LTR17_018160 [Elasticomyces elasticus]